MAEICETVAETRQLTRVSAVGLVTFTRVSVAAVTAEPYHFFTCFRQVSVEGNEGFRKRNFMFYERKDLETFRKSDFFFIFPSTQSDLNVHGNTRYAPESRFCLVSVDVRKHLLTELLGYFPETEFFLVSDDVFRPRVTRFRSGNTIFFLFLAIYRSGSFSTLYS